MCESSLWFSIRTILHTVSLLTVRLILDIMKASTGELVKPVVMAAVLIKKKSGTCFFSFLFERINLFPAVYVTATPQPNTHLRKNRHSVPLDPLVHAHRF